MALPTRGQPDWDDEIGNHISGIEASVQAASSQAAVAASDAAYARNRADEVHTAVVGPVEDAVATALGNTDLVTPAELASEVTAQLAADPTPANAAAAAAETAVNNEIATRDLLEGPTETDTGVLVSIRDASDHRTFLEANATDGGPTAYAASLIGDALGVTPPAATLTYIASGDSMTSDTYGGGTDYPTKLAALLGATVVDNGSGGRRASEIAIAAGGLAFPIAIPGAEIPAATTAVACTPTLPDTGPNTDRTFNVTVQGVACTLAYTHGTTSWTLARKTAAGTATPVPKTGAVAVSTPAYSGNSYLHLLWGGRNNTPKSSAAEPMIETAQWCKDNGAPFLLVSVCNSTAETAGTSGHTDILALNAELRDAFPREYIEMRGRLIVQGLALAGLSATPTDTADIANDCIPTSLLSDGLHPNDSGRVAIAAILHDELTIRGLA